jgi:hypothetical protein
MIKKNEYPKGKKNERVTFFYSLDLLKMKEMPQ